MVVVAKGTEVAVPWDAEFPDVRLMNAVWNLALFVHEGGLSWDEISRALMYTADKARDRGERQ